MTVHSQIEDVCFRQTLDDGPTRPVGWLTRNLLDEGKPRNLLLFKEDCEYLLEQYPDRQKVFRELKRVLTSLPGKGDSAASQAEVILETFAGRHAVLNPTNFVTVTLSESGPVPAVIFKEVDGLKLAIYPDFVENDLSRLEGYRYCGLDLLFNHYLEHIGARLHDMEWHRSPAAAAAEADAICEEVRNSILAKCTDICRAARPNRRTRRLQSVARELQDHYRQVLACSRVASYFVLHLISDFRCLICGFQDSEPMGAKNPNEIVQESRIDADSDQNLKTLLVAWQSYSNSDIDDLQSLAASTRNSYGGLVSEWVQQLVSFSLFILGLRKLSTELTTQGKTLLLPVAFGSLHFDATRAPVVSTTIAGLPSANSNAPLSFLIGTSESGESIRDIVRQKIFLSDLVMPFIPAQPASPTRTGDYDWIIREIEHGLLLGKPVMPALEVPVDLNGLKQSICTSQITWISQDPRIRPDNRANRVLDVLDKHAVTFHGTAPGKVDQNLVVELEGWTDRHWVNKVRALFEAVLDHMDEQARAWTLLMLRSTSAGPKNRDDVLPEIIESRLAKSADGFGRLLDRHNDTQVVVDTQKFPMIVHDRRTDKYGSGIRAILRAIGLPKSELTDARKQIQKHLDGLAEEIGRSRASGRWRSPPS
jgi:hypothetical protein